VVVCKTSKYFLFIIYLLFTDAMTTEHDNQSENTEKTTAMQQVMDNKAQ